MWEKNTETVRLRGLSFSAADKTDVLSALAGRLAAGEPTTVFTPNAAMADAAAKDGELLSLLQRADVNLPDGIGVVLAAGRAGKTLRRIPGIEAGAYLLRAAEKIGKKVFFLGGRAGVAERAAAVFPAVAGWRDGYFSECEIPGVLADIRASGADAVFVCLGFPKQERFILAAREKLPRVTLWMGLGGSLDVWAGEVKRAPGWVQKCGMEWLWRCVLDGSGEKWRRLPGMVHYVWTANRNNDG